MKRVASSVAAVVLALLVSEPVSAQTLPDQRTAPAPPEASGDLSGENPTLVASQIEKESCIPWATNDPNVIARVKQPVFSSRPNVCQYSVELAVAADDAWEVFVDGTQLAPTNGSSQNLWTNPAAYKTVVNGNGSNVVIGIHARDVSSNLSGLLANVRIKRLTFQTGLPDFVVSTGNGNGWYAFQQPLLAPKPIPANWNTALYLPFDANTAADWAPATLAAPVCTSIWNANSTFLTNWTAASGGTAPNDWVWEFSCQANTKAWRKDNWYRLEVPLDYCPTEVPPLVHGCTWQLNGHGEADGLYTTPPVLGCSTKTSPPSAICVDRSACNWLPSLCKYRCGFDFWNWACT
jgi:hypothetical protein